MENRFDNFAVGTGKHLPEDRSGNLNEYYIRFGAVQPCRLEPGVESIDADTGFHAFQESVPEVCRFPLFAKLNCRRHLNKKPNPRYFHRCVNPVERLLAA